MSSESANVAPMDDKAIEALGVDTLVCGAISRPLEELAGVRGIEVVALVSGPVDLVERIVAEGRVDPCLSKTHAFDDIPACHQLMLENRHPYGNMGVLVNAPKPGQGATA